MRVTDHSVMVALGLLLGTVFTSTASAQFASPTEVFATVTRQPSEGITAADFSADNVSKVGLWWRDMVASRTPESAAADLTVASSLFEMQGKRLGVAKISAANKPMGVMVFGIEGAEMARVQCITKSGKPIPIFSGPCGDKVREVFAVKLPR